MDRMNQYHEVAFEKLYRWIQVESRRMKEEAPEITIELRKGIMALRARPILFEFNFLI